MSPSITLPIGWKVWLGTKRIKMAYLKIQWRAKVLVLVPLFVLVCLLFWKSQVQSKIVNFQPLGVLNIQNTEIQNQSAIAQI